MSELTKEYLDQTLKAAVAPLATKQDVHDGIEDLVRLIADTIAIPFTKRVDRLEELLEVKQDVLTLKGDVGDPFGTPSQQLTSSCQVATLPTLIPDHKAGRKQAFAKISFIAVRNFTGRWMAFIEENTTTTGAKLRHML